MKKGLERAWIETRRAPSLERKIFHQSSIGWSMVLITCYEIKQITERIIDNREDKETIENRE